MKETVLPAMPQLLVAGETNCGCKRGHNEDNFCCASTTAGYVLAAVADGVGGSSGGEIASYMACHRILGDWKRFWAENPAPEEPQFSQFLCDSIRAANTDIFRTNLERKDRTPMCTTVAAAVFTPQMVIAAHAGDSRIYCSRHRIIRQITFDHTLRNKLAESGELHLQDYPPKNVISKALGPLLKVVPEVHTFFRAPEDRYLICSDGLNAHWTDEELNEVLLNAATPHEAAGTLITGTLKRGAVDNVTVVCVFPGTDAET